MRKRHYLLVTCLLACVWVVACSERRPNVQHSSDASPARYMINCRTDCISVENAILKNGGNITGRYNNFNFLAFDIPSTKQQELNLLSKYAMVKDRLIAKPKPLEQQSMRLSSSVKVAEIKTQAFTKKPSTYAFSNILSGASLLHEQNMLGDGVIVAVIDSGVANNPEIVPTLTGTVIGGENFVDEPGEPSATSTLNDAHGTWVGNMIAAHGAVTLEKTHEVAQAVSIYAPDSIIAIDDTQVEIPMSGTAPGAKIYSLKTFGANSPGASSSTIIAAMDRVLTLKMNFNKGMSIEPIAGDGTEDNPYVYNALDIKVLNLSLGGPALFPGAEMEDIVTDLLLQAGVVVVTAVGNEGPSAITGGAPGTAFSALKVGAASEPIHERILRELQLGQGKGVLFRPLNDLVVAPFSSRGPTSDGRIGVDLVANGVATLVQGPDGHVSIVSGTSFSTPTVAGAAALLWQAFPKKTASEIRNSLIEGANDSLIKTATPIDQGHGFLSLTSSYNLLLAGSVEPHLPDTMPSDVNTSVSETITNMKLDVIPATQSSTVRRYILKPGEVKQIFIESNADTEQLSIDLQQVLPFLPVEKQNQLNGDTVLLSLVDAPLSIDRSLLFDVFTKPQSFNFTRPQTGLLRLAVSGSRGNKGEVFVSLDINKVSGQTIQPVVSGTIKEGELFEYKFDITSKIKSLNLALQWNGNWSRFPAHDLDLVITDPEGNLFFDAATLNSPEMTVFDAPQPGVWTVIVDGFLLHAFADEYKLFVYDQDNNPLLPIN